MKAITIFSGKGGVGKSTISALLALALSKKHKVVLMDMDVNTPSAPVLFGNRTHIGNLTILSSGYDSSRAVSFQGNIIRKYLRSMAKQVAQINPDICIMDMPPGLTDVHLTVCTKLNPSAFILVIQPNKLSEEDALKASEVFKQTGVPIAGIIENMEGEIFGKKKAINIFGLPTLTAIPLTKELGQAGSNGTIDAVKNPLEDIAEDLFEQAVNVVWEITPYANKFEGVSEDKAKLMYIEQNPATRTYMGLASWDYIREKLMDWNSIVRPDKLLDENPTERVREMLEHLDENEEGLFMVCKPPSTEVPLFAGEIGNAKLIKHPTLYYGLPRVGYQTDKGLVHLFPHEVKPVTIELLLSLEKNGEVIPTTTTEPQRYLPTATVLTEIKRSFGNLTYVPNNWKEEYVRLGVKCEEKQVEVA